MASIPTEAADYLVFTAASEQIKAKGGNDTVKAAAGNDTVWGGSGNDLIYGEAGNDKLWGELGNDTMYGGAGNDEIIAEYGSDKIYGEAGSDNIRIINGDSHWVDAGDGNDVIYAKTYGAATRTYAGGKGADFFEITTNTYGNLAGPHGNAPLGTVVLPDFNPREGDVLSLRMIHDVNWHMGSLSLKGNTLSVSGFSGSGHGLIGKVVFPSGLSAEDIASHLLINFGDYVGQHHSYDLY